MGRHRSDPRGLGRYLLLGAVAVVALTLVVVGVLALRGALSSKKPRTPAPNSARSPHTVQQSAAVPALMIKIVREPCRVFVKNAASSDVLLPDNTDAPLGATLQFVQIPLQVQISNPKCAEVFVHGRVQAPGTRQPWIFTVQS